MDEFQPVAMILRYFGYAKVPPEAVMLIAVARYRWEKKPNDPGVGAALIALEELMRSAQ